MNILNFRKPLINQTFLAVSVLGRSLKLNIKYMNCSSAFLNQKENEIDLVLPKIYKSKDNTSLINMAIEKLYRKIAETEIEYAMEIARHILKFAPEDYHIKKLNNEFYRCSKKQIIVDPDIVKFNRETINTTIIQAFCKIKYKSNSAAYKRLLNNSIAEYEIYKQKDSRKTIAKVS